MRILLALAVVALVGCAYVEGRAIRDLKSTLITRGNDLVKKADAALVKLEAEKKTHEVSVIKAEETKIKQLVADLEAATDDAKIKTLEHELGALEARLAHELLRVSHPIVVGPGPVIKDPIVIHPLETRDAKETLVTKAKALEKKAEAEVKKLEEEKKTHEASVIKTEEAKIKKLVSELEAAKDDAKVKSIESELTQAEHKLEHELAKLKTTPTKPKDPKEPKEPKTNAKRDLKSTLITKGNDLLKQADETVTKLTAEHHVHEAALIKTEETHIKKLIADLEAATDETKVRALEHELTIAETRLQHEISRANHVRTNPIPVVPHVPVTRDLKTDLITKGNALLKRADEAIVKLETEKKTHEVTIVKAEEAAIKKLITDLEAATEQAQITHLEHQLSLAEGRLSHELIRIEHPIIRDPIHNPIGDLKTTLITRGNSLVKRAEDVIVKLEADKKTHEVSVIKAEETKIKQLVADLEAATDDAKIRTIEHELAALEARLSAELLRVGHPIGIPLAKRDLKSNLITRGNDLVKKADAAIVKLEADKKTHEVSVIKAEETKIKQLVADLEAATDDAKIKTLEHELGALEARLAHELLRVNHPIHVGPVIDPIRIPVVTRDAKSDLIAKGNALLKKADEAIKKLEEEKKTHEVTIVKTEEAKIKKLIADLEAATDDAKVKTIEHNLSTAEHKLQTELAKVNHTAEPKTTKAPATF